MREGQFTACNLCFIPPRNHWTKLLPCQILKPKLSWNLLNYDAHSPVGSLWDLDTVIYKQKSVPQFLPTSQVL